MSYRTMSYRTIVSIAAAALLGITSVSTEALAYRGGARAGGVHRGGGVAYHGGGAYHRGGYAYRGGYWRPGVAAGAAAVGAAAVGAAATGAYNNNYYNSAPCGYYPNPPCY
jgi:hypothetical protein